MTPVHTTTPPQQPDSKEVNVFFSHVPEETTNQLDNSINNPTYSDKEETVVNPNSDLGKKPEGVLITKKKLKIGAAVLAGLVALYAGFTTFNNKDKKEDPKPTETIESIYEEEPATQAIVTSEPTTQESSASIITETTQTETSTDLSNSVIDGIDYKYPPMDLALGYSFEKLQPEQQEKISYWNSLSAEEMLKQPEEDQQTFAYWVFINNKPRFDRVIAIQNANLSYIDNPETAEDYMNNIFYINIFVNNLIELNAEQTNMFRDFETAKKCIILEHSYSIESYESISASLSYMGQTNNYLLEQPTISEIKFIKNEDNVMIIQAKQSSDDDYTVEGTETFQNTIQIIEITDIYGNQIRFPQLKLSVGSDSVQYIK